MSLSRKILDFDPIKRTKKDLIWEMKREKNLTSDSVTLMNQTAKVILFQESDYYERTAWCLIKAKRGGYYLVEYTCPTRRALLKEWVHENFIDLMVLRIEY